MAILHHVVPNKTLPWSHNESDGVSNHRRLDCLLNRFFRQIKENIKALPHKGPVRRKMFPFDDVIMNKSHIVGQTGSSVPPFSLHPSQRSHVDVSPLPNTSSAVLSEFPLEWVNLIPSSLPTFWCMWWTGTRHLSNRKPVIIFREPVGNVSSSLRLLRSAQSLDTHWLGVTFHW